MPPQNTQFNPNQTNLPEDARQGKLDAKFILLLILGLILIAINVCFLYKTYFGKININEFSMSVGPANEIDEFANWKTYRNEEYGFEFKYPQSFGSLNQVAPPSNAGQKVTVASFESGGNYRLYLNIYKLDTYTLHDSGSGMLLFFDKDLDRWKAEYTLGIIGKEYYDMDSFISNGVVVYNYVWMDGGAASDKYIIPIKKSAVMIQISYGSVDYEVTHAKETLSTFKFIPSTSSGQVSTSTPGAVKDDTPFCGQAITRAQDTQTGEIRNFPSTCLPEGWIKIPDGPCPCMVGNTCYVQEACI